MEKIEIKEYLREDTIEFVASVMRLHDFEIELNYTDEPYFLKIYIGPRRDPDESKKDRQG